MIRSPDTIFAVATGGGRAAICVIRVSGPHARDIVRCLAGRVPPARIATLVRLRDPATDETLDHALVLFFEGAKSELGEDGVEFHLHGSPAVVAAILDVLGRQPGARQAEPGEFARRAFANGKLDLTQLEGLADLIEAETSWQRRQAQRQLSGAMRDATAPWRAALISASAEVETAIDFAEDVLLEASVHASVAALIDPVRAGLRRELVSAPAAERLRDGVHIVIAGPPNAGKSTLLNALVRREAAIVSAIAGTTRDPIEVHLDLGGCAVTLVDTAGLRESGDAIEKIGIFRARERADAADLVLWLSVDEEPAPVFSVPVWRIAAKADLRETPWGDDPPLRDARGRGTAEGGGGGGRGLETVEVEADLGSAPSFTRGRPLHFAAHGPPPPPSAGEDRRDLLSIALGETAHLPEMGEALSISARTGFQLDLLMARLTDFVQQMAGAGSAGLLARARHRDAFTATLGALDHIAEDRALPVELIAEDLRAARFALDRLIGKVDVEDILGEIFSRFCIGK